MTTPLRFALRPRPIPRHSRIAIWWVGVWRAITTAPPKEDRRYVEVYPGGWGHDGDGIRMQRVDLGRGAPAPPPTPLGPRCQMRIYDATSRGNHPYCPNPAEYRLKEDPVRVYCHTCVRKMTWCHTYPEDAFEPITPTPPLP